MALSSFDNSVKGVRNLIDFALTSSKSSPPTLVYTSSVGVFNSKFSVLFMLTSPDIFSRSGNHTEAGTFSGRAHPA